jgi:hypothetical protein
MTDQPKARTRRNILWLALQAHVAGYGRKPGKKSSLMMVLDAADLPGDRWTQVQERSWKTGAVGPRSDKAIRAREIGSISVLRKYRLNESRDYFRVQLSPFASKADAASMVRRSHEGFLPLRPATAVVISERVLEGVNIEEVDGAWAIEQSLEEARRLGNRKLVIGSVDRFMFLIDSSAANDGWDWSDVLSIAAIQGKKIRRTMKESSTDHRS